MVIFYHRVFPGITKTLVPLYNALKGKPKKLEWTAEADTAFNQAKDTLTNATMLTFPAPGACLQLTTDASNIAVGAALEQLTSSGPTPIAFSARSCPPYKQGTPHSTGNFLPSPWTQDNSATC